MLGVKNGTIDAKGRIIIPAGFRKELGDEMVVFKSLDDAGCLFIYSKEEWDGLVAKISALPFNEARYLERFIYPAAAELVCDGQGRALIPIELRQYAGLTDSLIINGTGRRLELWNAEKWAAAQQVENMAGYLKEIGF